MRPRTSDPTPQSDMFRESLEALLDPRHELLRLAARIDWERLDALYGAISWSVSVAPVCRPD